MNTHIISRFIVLTIFFSLVGVIKAQSDTTFVKVETSRGDFVLALYNDTPIHKDNFIKNVKAKAYDNLLFHRVINNFMIQAGNPNSRNIPIDSPLIPEKSSTLLKNEIMPNKHFHKRGALAAARTSDEVNPEKKSSPMQFYIVTGTYYTSDDLDDIEEESGLKLTKEQRDAYMYKGGMPSLDGRYTVFGEVVKGYDTINDIQNVETDSTNRPLKNIVIKSMTILDK